MPNLLLEPVIHGNLKPTNLILLQGSKNTEVKLLDLAWSAIGVAVPPAGTPSFLAPEQLSGSPPTAASDQCSLIMMLQRYLTQGGRRLAQEDGVPPMLAQIVERATRESPQARFSSMLEVTEAVKTAVINKRAGGMGLISGRKAFQRPMVEGVRLLNAIQDVYLSKEVTVA